MQQHKDVVAVFVDLRVSEDQVLYLMTAEDGTTHRIGTGSELNKDRDLFIGNSTAFLHLKSRITAGLLQWLGNYTDPSPMGKPCRLTIGFRMADGREVASHWEYGTQSQSPAPEVCDFVLAAIQITDPWYEQQKALAGGC
jgi:hypothetical protein